MLRIQLGKSPKFEAVNFDRRDLLRIGAKAIELIQKRVSHGLGLTDRKMKPLSKSYAARKRKLGQPPIRNLMFSGSMLGSMTIIQASDNKVVIGFTRQAEVRKAAGNQSRSPWFGISPKDEQSLETFAWAILRRKLHRLNRVS